MTEIIFLVITVICARSVLPNDRKSTKKMTENKQGGDLMQMTGLIGEMTRKSTFELRWKASPYNYCCQGVDFQGESKT